MGSSDQDAYDSQMKIGKYAPKTTTRPRLEGVSNIESTHDFQIKINDLIQGVGDYREMPHPVKLMINALALSGEAGEIANKVKKHCWYGRHKDSEFNKDIQEELGDVLYHVAQLATEINVTLQSCMDIMITKAESRRGE